MVNLYFYVSFFLHAISIVRLSDYDFYGAHAHNTVLYNVPWRSETVRENRYSAVALWVISIIIIIFNDMQFIYIYVYIYIYIRVMQFCHEI